MNVSLITCWWRLFVFWWC